VFVSFHGMAFEDGGVPSFLAGPLGGAIRKFRQFTFFNHPVQRLIGDIHLLHEFLHGDDDFVSIIILRHTKTPHR